mmetsp:Transcript_35235/g.63411  ORF Transcript_35235/g.63411 Transcript_35235/m.63411 type:complete len:565 (-) Transcript_35235:214-1908(-)
MFHFPRHGVSFALFIIFHVYDSVQAFSAPSKHSELVMHVGNLDWTIPADAISDLLLTAVGGVTSSAGDDCSEETVKVTVKALPTPLRKRDEGKMHGGSAAIEFSSKKDATTAMLKLNSLILARTEEKEDKQWRVRWAYDVPPIIRSPDNIKEVVLTKERIQLRKNRAEQYARRRKRIAQKTDDLIRLVVASIDDDDENMSGLWSLDGSNVPEILDAPMLDWSQCPDEIDPVRGGGLREGTRRGQRKQSAVEAFLYVLQAALLLDHAAANNGADEKNNVCRRRPFVADLGCGGGNLSLPLAWWLQKQGLSDGVVAVDINGFALKILAERASLSGVSIETMEQDLLHLVEQPALQHSTKETTGIPHDGSDSSTVDDRLRLADCAAVVSLHACGAASDLAMAAAISHSLPFALSPCCIGKMNASRQNTKQDAGGRIIGMPKLRSVDRSAAPSEISYPRSELLNDIISVEEYQLLAAAADYGTATNPNTNHDTLEERNRTQRCRKAKTIVELDRLQWAKEQGYVVRMVELPRIGPLYNKRELLLGAKKGTEVATRLSSCLDIISSTPV